MDLEFFVDQINLNRVIKITITDRDIFEAYKKFTEHDKFMLRHFDKENSSIEEKLMALQIYAKVLEDKEQSRENMQTS